MRKMLCSIVVSAMATAVSAQQPFVISASGGIHNTSSSAKSSSYLGNGYNLHANVLAPLLGTNNGRFRFGMLAGGIYSAVKDLEPATENLKAAYKLYNGSLDISNVQNEGAANNGFTVYLGVQGDLWLGRFTLSPAVSGGYFSLRQHGFAQTATIPVNGTKQTVTLLDQPATKRTGFVTIPQLKISYSITNAFGIFTSAGFQLGPKMEVEQRQLEPAGGFNSNHTYEPSQLSAGKLIAMPASDISYQALMLNAGVSWTLGRKLKKLPTMPSRLSMNLSTSRQTQGKTFGEKVAQGLQVADSKSNNPLYEDKGLQSTNPLVQRAMPGQPIKGVVVNGGKNPGGSLRTATTNEQGTFELNGLEAGVYKFTLTLPDEPQDKSINEKGVKRSEAPEMARPGQPVKGVIVKGGKNPGGSMINLTIDADGTIQFEVLEAGDYQFRIETGEDSPKRGAKTNKGNKEEKATSGLKDVLKTQV